MDRAEKRRLAEIINRYPDQKKDLRNFWQENEDSALAMIRKTEAEHREAVEVACRLTAFGFSPEQACFAAGAYGSESMDRVRTHQEEIAPRWASRTALQQVANSARNASPDTQGQNAGRLADEAAARRAAKRDTPSATYRAGDPGPGSRDGAPGPSGSGRG